MKLFWQIREKHPDQHSIVVRYFSDEISENDLSVDGNVDEKGKPIRCRTDFNITLPVNPPPTRESIQALIEAHAPYSFFQTLSAVRNNKIAEYHDVVDDMMKDGPQEIIPPPPPKIDIVLDEELRTALDKFHEDEIATRPEQLGDDDIKKLLKNMNKPTKKARTRK